MVLQRAPQRANLWGWTKAGSTVVVDIGGLCICSCHLTFLGKQYITNAHGSSGAWNVLLPAWPAGGPYDIKIKSSGGPS